MGTKRQIAPLVADVIADTPDGPLLDLFSGICAVGTAVAPSRNVWCNDAQRFASEVAAAFFTSDQAPIPFEEAADKSIRWYSENRAVLSDRWAEELEIERAAIEGDDLSKLTQLVERMPNVAISPALELERQSLVATQKEFPYRLFSITFSGGYLGLEQCIQVDATRYAIDQLLADGLVNREQHRWMCLALCQAVCKVATTTGHFAQYMKVKENNKRRFLAQRRRVVRREWLAALASFVPVGGRTWRTNNRSYNADAGSLLNQLYAANQRPAVIYADPPYTQDQYSRYYHLYETLLLYDYPVSIGVGRYRARRFVSSFSTKTLVKSAIEDLIARCASLGSRLVLTYPENGLLANSREVITAALKAGFGKSTIVQSIDHFHSSLGGSKGAEKYPVKEIIYAAG